MCFAHPDCASPGRFLRARSLLVPRILLLHLPARKSLCPRLWGEAILIKRGNCTPRFSRKIVTHCSWKGHAVTKRACYTAFIFKQRRDAYGRHLAASNPVVRAVTSLAVIYRSCSHTFNVQAVSRRSFDIENRRKMQLNARQELLLISKNAAYPQGRKSSGMDAVSAVRHAAETLGGYGVGFPSWTTCDLPGTPRR